MCHRTARPPPPAGERAASGAGVRPRRALPDQGRAAQPGGAGGRQPGGGHVSGRAVWAAGAAGRLLGGTSLPSTLSVTCALWRKRR